MHGIRRRLIGSMGLVLVAPGLARGQGLRRIGYIASTDPAKTPALEGLRQGLREHGLVEGQSIAIEYLWRDGSLGAGVAASLIKLGVELVFAWGSPAVAAAKQATSNIPIVFVGVGDPIGAGFVSNFARPGGNITGITNNARDLAAKRMELLALIVPAGSRVAVLGNPANPLSSPERKEFESAARKLGIALLALDIRKSEDIEAAFASAAASRAAAVMLQAEPLFIAHGARVAELGRRHRIATFYSNRELPEAGGLMSYGVNATEMFRRGARYVALILRGSHPGDLPVEQATQFELTINVATAKAIGVTVPPTLLLRADRVIE